MIRIEPVHDRVGLKQFVQFPSRLYQSDPAWVPPITLERLHFYSKKNPYFDHARWQCWLAYRGKMLVGRISAQIDELHLVRHDSRTGFFGSLESEDSAEVFQALLKQQKVGFELKV